MARKGEKFIRIEPTDDGRYRWTSFVVGRGGSRIVGSGIADSYDEAAEAASRAKPKKSKKKRSKKKTKKRKANMDPQAALDAAERNIQTGQKTASEARSQEAFRNAAERLEDYWEWRNRGGFEPPGGDARAHALVSELWDAWSQREEEEYRDRMVHAEHNPGQSTKKLKNKLLK